MRRDASQQLIMPPLLKFLARHLFFGLAGGVVFGSAVLYFDLGGIGSLVMASSDKYLWMFLLYFGIFITFGSVAMGFGIMSLGQENEDRPD